MDLDQTRLKIMKLIQDSGSDLKNTSIAIGRNAAYLHQYLYRGTPRVLPEDAREALAAHLGVDDDSLRAPGSDEPKPVEAAADRAGQVPHHDGAHDDRWMALLRWGNSTFGHPLGPAPSLMGWRRAARPGCFLTLSFATNSALDQRICE